MDGSKKESIFEEEGVLLQRGWMLEIEKELSEETVDGLMEMRGT